MEKWKVEFGRYCGIFLFEQDATQIDRVLSMYYKERRFTIFGSWVRFGAKKDREKNYSPT